MSVRSGYRFQLLFIYRTGQLSIGLAPRVHAILPLTYKWGFGFEVKGIRSFIFFVNLVSSSLNVRGWHWRRASRGTTEGLQPLDLLATRPCDADAAQTYEGGIGGEPGNEAHGGYTYCGLAALSLVGSADALNLPRLLHWAARCQVRRDKHPLLGSSISTGYSASWPADTGFLGIWGFSGLGTYYLGI